MSNVLDELRRAMKADGRSLNSLARDGGLGVPMLSRFASGERGLSVESASKLAVALGLRLVLVKGKAKLTRRGK